MSVRIRTLTVAARDGYLGSHAAEFDRLSFYHFELSLSHLLLESWPSDTISVEKGTFVDNQSIPLRVATGFELGNLMFDNPVSAHDAGTELNSPDC